MVRPSCKLKPTKLIAFRRSWQPRDFKLKPSVHNIVGTPNVINLLGPKTNVQDEESNIHNGLMGCGRLCFKFSNYFRLDSHNKTCVAIH